MSDRTKEKPSMDFPKKLTLQDLDVGYRLVRAAKEKPYHPPVSARSWIKKGMFTTSRLPINAKRIKLG